MKSANEKISNQSQLLETKFGTMEYAIEGEGKPVLLIHGAGGGFDQGLWLGKICLDNNYQFIAPSKFGYLNSEVPENYSAKLQAELYKILLDHLGIKKVIVIGVSAGGPSAMEFANDYPQSVDKLILLSAVSMAPNTNDKPPIYIKIIQQIQKSDYAYWLFTKIFKTQMLSLLGIPSDDYKKFTPEQKNLAQEMLDVMHPMSLRYEGTIIDGLIIKDFKIPQNITVQTLIIHSKNDGLVSYSHAEYSNNNIKGSKLILYDNGGHGALSELKDVRNQIKNFLNSSTD
jgi:pimeloyl-ACP methyl ester carboxylesterase